MKKRNVLALALALVMSVGMSSSVFAATWSGNAPKENDVEKVVLHFYLGDFNKRTNLHRSATA